MEWDQSENKILAYGGAYVKSNKFSLKNIKLGISSISKIPVPDLHRDIIKH